MTAIKAADLPEGSVVANGTLAVFRVLPGIGMIWHGTDKKRYDDEDVDRLLADGAKVLRHGYGDEGEKKLARIRGRDEVNELVEEQATELAVAEGSTAFSRHLPDEPERQAARDTFRARVRQELGL